MIAALVAGVEYICLLYMVTVTHKTNYLDCSCLMSISLRIVFRTVPITPLQPESMIFIVESANDQLNECK